MLFLTAFLLCCLTCFAQNGINYKAIIKDDLGNVVADDLVQVQFKILQGAAQTNIYEESHTPTTDANGLVIVNIGEGTVVSGDFETIDWASDDTFLNVQLNTGSGLVDLGTTEFKAVPYALNAGNVTGLEALDEGSGIGWRLKGRDPEDFEAIGQDAVDLSYGDINQFIGVGAIGDYSLATGLFNRAFGNYSTAMGVASSANGNRSFAMGFNASTSGDNSFAIGNQTNASGLSSFAIGNFSSALGENSLALGSTTSRSFAETSIGQFNEFYTPFSTTSWELLDQLFVIGNGFNGGNRSNALTVLKNGKHTINSSTDGLVINAGNGNNDSGISVFSEGRAGINIQQKPKDGIYINYPLENGVVVFNSGINGGFFRGDESGVHAESSNDTNPDIILGGTSGGTSTDDDGIIASDPTYTGSDIFLRSHDAVVIQLDFDNNETGQFEIKDGNQIEVFEVDESGNVFANGYNINSSDRRLKKDIEDLSYGLKEILQLQPKAYNWKNRIQDYKSLGLIAQEVQPLIKEIVTARDDQAKTLGIRYTELIPILINAIKEQQTQIETLKTENKSKDSVLVQVLKRLETLENVKPATKKEEIYIAVND